MSTLREPKPGENVFYYCPDCGNRFSDKKPLLPLIPVKCPKCGSTQTRPISLLGKLARWVYRRN